MAAASPKNSKGLGDRCRWLSQVLPMLSRSLKSRADSYLPAPAPRRAAPGLEFLQSSRCWAAVLLYQAPGLGCPPPPPPTTDETIATATDSEHRGTPAAVHAGEASPAPRPPDDYVCRGPARQ